MVYLQTLLIISPGLNLPTGIYRSTGPKNFFVDLPCRRSPTFLGDLCLYNCIFAKCRISADNDALQKMILG